MKYSDNQETDTLPDISFNWQGSGKIGIVGLSGSGKSTLIKLLGGFLEATEPSIEINQSTMTNLQKKAWQDQLFYIPQDPYIFHGSLKDNITFYHPQATFEECVEAVKQAGLIDVVEELPDGWDTVIGEGGHLLSGGQYQRIAVARALLDKQRKILLFDEPTAHLDVETEYDLKETMLPLFENKLVFFATHRLHWMKEMDYILVMEDGKIIEQGTYSELRAKNGAYQRFVDQLKGGL